MSTDTNKKAREIEVGVIRLDGDTQQRAGTIDQEVVAEYAAAYAVGIPMPAVVVFFDGAEYWLADGFYRYHAAKKAGPKILAEVRQGTVEEARWFSFSANQTHGLRRSNADKLKAVKAALAHPKGEMMSDRSLARHVGVSAVMVAKYRAEIAATVNGLQSTQRTGEDGRTIETGNIGKQKPEPAEAIELGEGVEVADVPREEKERGSRKDAKTQTEEGEGEEANPAGVPCRNCGSTEVDEDGECCAECFEPLAPEDEEPPAEKPREPPSQIERFVATFQPAVMEFAAGCSLEGRATLAARLENLAEMVREV